MRPRRSFIFIALLYVLLSFLLVVSIFIQYVVWMSRYFGLWTCSLSALSSPYYHRYLLVFLLLIGSLFPLCSSSVLYHLPSLSFFFSLLVGLCSLFLLFLLLVVVLSLSLCSAATQCALLSGPDLGRLNSELGTQNLVKLPQAGLWSVVVYFKFQPCSQVHLLHSDHVRIRVSSSSTEKEEPHYPQRCVGRSRGAG